MSSVYFSMMRTFNVVCFFFFNDTATTEIYTLSLHDALPICAWTFGMSLAPFPRPDVGLATMAIFMTSSEEHTRSEEHTSELQSRLHLVCRLLLEKKKKNNSTHTQI